MEHQHHSSHHYRAGAGTTALGVIGTVLGGAAVLGEGGFLGLGRRGRDGYGHGGCGDGHYGGGNEYINRFELAQSEKIARLEAEKYALISEKYTDNKVAALQMEICCLKAKEERLEQNLHDYKVYNNEEVRELEHRLNAVTKEVIPASVICPTVLLAPAPGTPAA